MIEPSMASEFLTAGRIAVIGASDDPRKFGNTVYRALRDHGVDVVAVNRRGVEIAGDPSYAAIAEVPGPIDCAIVMVAAERAAGVVAECLDRGVPRIWLFKGLGAPGAISTEAVDLCRDRHVAVIPGACPLMFLEPVGWFHRLHRRARQLNHSLARAS
jgi:predicted CoA-binding protein